MPSYPFSARIRNAWNAFVARDKQEETQKRSDLTYMQGYSTSIQTARTRLHPGNERSIIASVYTRIAIDVAANVIRHVRVDNNDHFIGTMNSGLNECLTVEANIDQTGREFIFDAVMSMLDEGCVALIPVDTSESMINSNSFDIITLRVGKVVQWYPWAVQVEVYNERTGHKEQVTLPKDRVGLIENPLYAVMNEPNSTLRRLVRKLNLLDAVDEQSASGKLDLIIQLPYTIKSQARQEQAEMRRKQIEEQLEGTKYGIAYIDGTERVTQLNRPAENNLMSQIEYLTSMLYGQLGMTQAIFDGTADETTMLNYYNRTIEPILAAICDELTRKFLTKTARSQGQRVTWFKDPFRLVTTTQIADMADRFTRNEVLSSNEIRAAIGYRPVDDPAADELRNKNLNPAEGVAYPSTSDEYSDDQEIQDLEDGLYELDEFENELDSLQQGDLAHYASPYYDPEKAHEYYEAHKQLKGRTSIAKLNETGKAAARYVKDQLQSERKEKASALKKDVQSQIKQMRSSLRGLSGTALKRRTYEIKQQISALREELKAQLAELKAAYDDKYADELDAMRNDSSFVKSR